MSIIIAGLLVTIGLIVASNRISNAIQISADALIQQMELEQQMFDVCEINPKDLN
ncbi:hypothetical protein [Bradyrhizobium phage BDU-MI-1]|nr:hypothetical protein [Bradyrhizobium phage BDU-MI-1]